jgi:hypothetical protein
MFFPSKYLSFSFFLLLLFAFETVTTALPRQNIPFHFLPLQA